VGARAQQKKELVFGNILGGSAHNMHLGSFFREEDNKHKEFSRIQRSVANYTCLKLK
jgi:hypothetical protein